MTAPVLPLDAVLRLASQPIRVQRDRRTAPGSPGEISRIARSLALRNLLSIIPSKGPQRNPVLETPGLADR